MIPFQVDPSWYEKYWWREPAPRRLSAFALLRRGLERFKKIQGSNVMTDAIRFHQPGGRKCSNTETSKSAARRSKASGG
jgi:hypothetical protein